MDNKFNRLEEKLDKLFERFDEKFDENNNRLNDIDKNLVVYNEQLQEHMKRTKLLEDRVSPLEEQSKFVSNIILFFKIAAAFSTFVLGAALTLKELGIL